MTAAHPLLGRAFGALDGAGIRWAVLRGEDGLDRPTGDVDLLFDPETIGAAAVALRSVGFVPLPTAGRGTHRFFLGYAPEDDRWVKLDVVTELAFGPGFAVKTGLAEGILDRRIRDGGVALLAPDDAFWSLLLHLVLDKDEVGKRRWAALAARAVGTRSEPPWRGVVAALAGDPAVADALPRLVASGDPALVADVVGSMRRRAAATSVRAGRTSGIPRALAGPIDRWAERLRGFLARPGLSVALLGQDGSGKSTLCRAIAASVPFPARTVYMGLWKQPAPPRMIIPGSDLAYRLSLAWRGYLKGRAHRLLRRLVIFDRYTYDALLGSSERLGPKQRVYLTVLARSCPPPDLVIVLDTPADVAHARKPDHPLASLERDRLRFLELAGMLPDAMLVDASRPHHEVKTEVVDLIWRAYVARWAR